MGKRESYEPGTFNWLNLSTAHADGSKIFYGELLGWEFEDSVVPGVPPRPTVEVAVDQGYRSGRIRRSPEPGLRDFRLRFCMRTF